MPAFETDRDRIFLQLSVDSSQNLKAEEGKALRRHRRRRRPLSVEVVGRRIPSSFCKERGIHPY